MASCYQVKFSSAIELDIVEQYHTPQIAGKRSTIHYYLRHLWYVKSQVADAISCVLNDKRDIPGKYPATREVAPPKVRYLLQQLYRV